MHNTLKSIFSNGVLVWFYFDMYRAPTRLKTNFMEEFLLGTTARFVFFHNAWTNEEKLLIYEETKKSFNVLVSRNGCSH